MKLAAPGRPVTKDVRGYLQFIGALGGMTSRRDLSQTQARRMVEIREAKRALVRQGKAELARGRWPLNVKAENPKKVRQPKMRAGRSLGVYSTRSYRQTSSVH